MEEYVQSIKSEGVHLSHYNLPPLHVKRALKVAAEHANFDHDSLFQLFLAKLSCSL